MTRLLARHIDATSLRLLNRALHAPPPTAARLARLSGLLRRLARLLRPPDPEALAVRARLDDYDREVYPYRLARRHAAYHASIRAELEALALRRRLMTVRVNELSRPAEFASLASPPAEAVSLRDAVERLTTATLARMTHEDEPSPFSRLAALTPPCPAMLELRAAMAGVIERMKAEEAAAADEPCYLSHARGRLLYRPGTGYVGAVGPRVRVTVTDDGDGRTLTVERHDGYPIPRETMEALGSVLARYLGRTPTAEVLASVLAEAEAVLEGGDSRPN